MNNGLQSMTDTDGDGLDDIVEVLMGTSISDPDTDNDSLSDLDERLLGSDPLSAPTPSEIQRLDRSLKVDAYTNGGDFVIQISALYGQTLDNVTLHWATQNNYGQVRPSLLASLPNDDRQLSSGVNNMRARVYRVQLPVNAFLRYEACAVGVTAFLDGVEYGDQIHLLSRSGMLLEFRDSASFGRQSQGGGQNGGLFPTAPGGNLPGEISVGQICVQTLQEIAALGTGQRLFQVSDSFCDYLPDAACFSNCTAAVGDSVVGIDIIGLLGG